MRKIIIGSRGSDLALWQANHVKDQLSALGYEVEIKVIITQGDAIQHLSFDKMEGKGFFTKEIESELLKQNIDLAIHSHKDLETNPPAGLEIAAVSSRANPCDALLIRKESLDKNERWSLKKDAVIGTSSARRQALVRAFRSDCSLADLRGNVPTRIDKLRQGQYDAIILAQAGIQRLKLNLSDLEVVELNPEQFVPAPAQGVLAMQIREGDSFTQKAVAKIHDKEVAKQIEVERKVLNLMDGGCQLPLGVYTEKENIYVAFSPSKDQAASNFRFDFEEENVVDKIVHELQVFQ